MPPPLRLGTLGWPESRASHFLNFRASDANELGIRIIVRARQVPLFVEVWMVAVDSNSAPGASKQSNIRRKQVEYITRASRIRRDGELNIDVNALGSACDRLENWGDYRPVRLQVPGVLAHAGVEVHHRVAVHLLDRQPSGQSVSARE